jgi:signal transduction histidine kinase
MEKRTNNRRFVSGTQTGAKQKSRIVGHAASARGSPEKQPAPQNALLNIRRIRAWREIDSAITSTFDLRTVLDVLLQRIEIFLPIAAVTTAELLHPETGELELLACRGLSEKEWESLHLPFRSAAGKAAESKAPVTVLDIATDPQMHNYEIFLERGLVSYLGVPISAQDRVLGVLGLFTRQEHAFGKKEIEFLNTLAGQAAVAIHAARLYEQTISANKVRDEFLSVMSHELRTPMSVVMGYAGMIKEKLLGEINPQQEEALQKLLSRAGDHLHLINVIMQTTRIESRSVKPDCFPVNLSALLTRLRSEVDTAYDKKDVSLVWDYPLTPVTLATDGEKLAQILQSLIDNAIKFTDRGSVTISVRIAPHASELFIEIKVADTGIGIPADQLPFIFDKFFQVDSSDTRPFGGVGLGLYIVKKFTDLLGGKIEVESEPEIGTTFRVRIPCSGCQ